MPLKPWAIQAGLHTIDHVFPSLGRTEIILTKENVSLNLLGCIQQGEGSVMLTHTGYHWASVAPM